MALLGSLAKATSARIIGWVLLSLLLAASISSSSGQYKTLFPAPPGFTAPPDAPIHLPPQPPALPQLPIGPIRSMADVCRVCTSMPYNGTCTSTYARACLQAQSTFITDVLGIRLAYCDCFISVASDLLTTCSKIPPQVGWLGNCQSMCYYGPKCPFSATLYALLAPRFQSLAVPNARTTQDKAAPGGSALMLLQFDVSLDKGARLCYRLSSSPALPRVQSATISRAGIGYHGEVVATLFSGGGKAARQGCQAFSRRLMQVLSTDPPAFYIQVVTSAGSVRGQLLAAPHLAAAATSGGANAPCSGQLCMAVADLTVSLSAVSFSLRFTRDVAPRLGATLRPSGGGSVAPITLFAPGVAAVSDNGGVTPDASAVAAMLTDPSSFVLAVSTTALPHGALSGALTDTLTVSAELDGGQVVPPSGVAGSASFLAQVGAGGICYRFQFQNAQVQDGWAYLHKATYTTHGPVVLSTALPISSGNKTRCLKADTSVTGPIIQGAPQYYVQVYSKQHPNGLMRGQLAVEMTLHI